MPLIQSSASRLRPDLLWGGANGAGICEMLSTASPTCVSGAKVSTEAGAWSVSEASETGELCASIGSFMRVLPGQDCVSADIPVFCEPLVARLSSSWSPRLRPHTAVVRPPVQGYALAW